MTNIKTAPKNEHPTFVCGHCGGIFPDLTDQLGHDPVVEAAANFPDMDPADAITVCDDCYDRYVQGQP